MTNEATSATHVLYFCPQMESLAKEIVGMNSAFALGEIKWGTFRDGFPDSFVGKSNVLKRGETIFLASFDSMSEAFHQLCMIYTLARLAESLTVAVPFYSMAFMERVAPGGEGRIITAKTVAIMLSAIPVGHRGAAKLIFYDVHALSIFNFFGPTVVVRIKTALKYLPPYLAQLENVSLCFPDRGSRDRFQGMPDKYGLEAYPKILCGKDHVESGNHKVEIVSGCPRGRHCVIIDDAVLYGGTTLVTKDALFAAGAAEVSLFVTHGVFADETWKLFLDAGFSNIWITNSCPKTVAAVAGRPPFRPAISLARSINRELTE